MTEVREYRVITERPLGGGDSRVERVERLVPEREAIKLAGYWTDRTAPDGTRGWVETRTVALWEDFGG